MNTVVHILYVALIAVGIFFIVYAQKLKREEKDKEESSNADTFQTSGIVSLILGVGIMIAFLYNKDGRSRRKSSNAEYFYTLLGKNQQFVKLST